MKWKYIFFIITALAAMAFVNQRKKKVIFFGDSITQAGINPEGYISQLGQLLATSNKGNAYELIGAGISGNKVYDLYLRMDQDVLEKKPDVVFIWIGVNDVWHKQTHHTGTDPDKFVKFYEAIIKKLRDNKIEPVLCTPAAIGEKWDGSNELDADLDKYVGMIRDLSKTSNCKLVDLRQLFMNYSKQNNPDNLAKGILTTDGVHLNTTGNKLVAEEMVKVL